MPTIGDVIIVTSRTRRNKRTGKVMLRYTYEQYDGRGWVYHPTTLRIVDSYGEAGTLLGEIESGDADP